MKIRRLDSSGHSEVECAPSEVIAELEKMMNGGHQNDLVCVKEPGKPETVTKDIQGIATLDPDTEVTLVPPFIGG